MRDPDGSRLSVTYEFEVDDATAEVQRLQRIFEDHDLPIEEVKSVQGFQTTGPGYGISISILDGQLRVNVGLVDRTPDEQADEVLQPVIDAVGRSD